ncbi:class I SAM-dependent methyltransferase [Halomarina pelagica]|uniref:class I SAM-dependent methyltransferase n=1 Tax=Halomarina pelagica TaxID=2961599 RepID=UPI0020C2F830|nr:class I SAM-dependent methyltransferase [Halomarina sp. BND7]
MTPDTLSPDERAKRVWSLGSYPDIAPNFLGMAAHLVEAVGIGTTDTVLDVGCGTGNAAITAARRGARVTGLDIVPAMLDEACENATITDIETIDWREGSATDLPFEDDVFDVTLSCLGHMFAEPPDDAGQELLRVTRPGGRIAFTSWTPDGLVPAMGAVLNNYLPPNPNPPEPPFLWGDPDVVRERVGGGVESLVFETGTALTPVLSPAHYWEKAITESGLFIVALDTVAEADHPALREEMIETIEHFFDASQNAVPMNYVLTTATVT